MCIVQRNKWKTISSPVGVETKERLEDPTLSFHWAVSSAGLQGSLPAEADLAELLVHGPQGPPNCQQLRWCSNSFEIGRAQNQEDLQGKEAIGMLPLDKKKLFSFHVTKTGISLAARNV